MDTLRGLDDDRTGTDHDDDGNASVNDVGHDIGTDERRMHVRAYNHWVSLLGGRAYPAIDDLDPTNISDFGSNSVLLDFRSEEHTSELQSLMRISYTASCLK